MRKAILALAFVALGLYGCGPGGGTGGGGTGGGGTGSDPCVLSGRLDTERTLSPSECSPYRVQGEFDIGNTGKLLIEPGTTLEFGQDAALVVSGHGVLKAVGTAAHKIAFLGAQPHRGYWKGVVFNNANSFDNELTYVEIEHAGGEEYWDSKAFHAYRAALSLERGSRIKLKNVLIRESAGSGIFVDEDVDLAAFQGLQVTKNASFPLLIYARKVHLLDSASDFTGNDAGMDYVRVADWHKIQTATWKRLSVPYRVENELTVADGELLTIEPGTHLVFEQDTGIYVEGHTGGLRAAGTASEKIVFTALSSHPGYWCGLIFDDSNNLDNLLDYVKIEYGGSGSCSQGSSYKANVLVESAGNASSQYIRIYHSEINHSAGYGVVIAQETNANNIQADNTFVGNAQGNFFRMP